MKTISDYSILCTLEQTHKALELGAPIDNIEHFASIGKCYVSGNNIYDNGKCYFIPTAEQMISWLEEKTKLEIRIEKYMNEYWSYTLYDKSGIKLDMCDCIYTSRKGANIAAIDAALYYLINNKK